MSPSQFQPSRQFSKFQHQIQMQSGSESPLLQTTLIHPHSWGPQNHGLGLQRAMLQSHQRLQLILPNGSSATNEKVQAQSSCVTYNWFDAAYKKIQFMKEKYLPLLLMYKKARGFGLTYNVLEQQPDGELARMNEKEPVLVDQMVKVLCVPRSQITCIRPEKLLDYMRKIDYLCSNLRKSSNLRSKIPPCPNKNTDSRFHPMQAQGSTDSPIGSPRNSINSLPDVHQYTMISPHQTNDVASVEQTSLLKKTNQSLPRGVSSVSMAGNEKNQNTVMSKMEQQSLHATEQPIDRLLDVVKSMSSEDSIAACADMESVVCINDSSPPFYQSDSIKRRRIFDTESSTSTSDIEKPKIEGTSNLLQEIEGINRNLVETTVELDSNTDDDLDGTIVKILYNGISFAQLFKLHFNSLQMMPNLSIRLLVPTSYPNSSPMVLDALSDGSSENPEDLTEKVKCKFRLSLRILPELISLGEMARTWDGCARAVFFEFWKTIGGKSFSLRYGNWESCA